MKPFLAILLAGACLAGYIQIQWHLDQWRASVFDYRERIKVTEAIRRKNLGEKYGREAILLLREASDDERLRVRIVEYHRELERLLSNKPWGFYLTPEERVMQSRIQNSLKHYAQEERNRPRQTHGHPAMLGGSGTESLSPVLTAPAEPPALLLKIVKAPPAPTPTRDQVLSEIERKYGRPAPPGR